MLTIVSIKNPEMIYNLHFFGNTLSVTLNKDQTKSVLISLAKSRFAMGSAKLKKMRLGEIKQQIEGALQHEMSISIISSEAQGSANNRTS